MNEDQQKPDDWSFDKAFEESEDIIDPLDGLVERTRVDPIAPFEVIAELADLRQRDPPAYFKLRFGLTAIEGWKQITSLEKAMDAYAKAQGLSGDFASDDNIQVTILLSIAKDLYLFRTEEDVAYADVVISGHRETHAILGKGLTRFLRHRYYVREGGAPTGAALNTALRTLEARAVFEGPIHQVFTRVANVGDRVYLDLCDDEHRVVEVSGDGWKVLDAPPNDVRFRRTPGMLPLPLPMRGGSIEVLRTLLHITTDDEFVLTIAWLLSAMFGRGPYPVMVLVAEQGAAKSTRARMLRSVFDPHLVPIRSPFREMREAHISAKNSFTIVLDNLSALPQWMSDLLCCFATGGGNAYRTLYTDEDEHLFNIKRPQVVNGIEDVAVRADLADRALYIAPTPITESERRPEDELWAEFEKVLPGVLGALLDALVHGLSRLEAVKPDKLPRMADFMKLMLACETAFWTESTFEKAYSANLAEVTTRVLEADYVAMAVREFMSGRQEWQGTMTDLLKELDLVAGDRITKTKTWPNSGHALSTRLRRAASNLRKVGIEIELDLREPTKARRRLIRITAPGKSTRPNGRDADASDAADAGSGASDPADKNHGASTRRPRGARPS